MKRAIRTARPSSLLLRRRRCRRLGQGSSPPGFPRGTRTHNHRDDRQRTRWLSSVPYDDGFHHHHHLLQQQQHQQHRHGESRVSAPAKPRDHQHHQLKRGRKRRQRSSVAAAAARDDDDDGIAVFATIEDAQESMQDLLDRLVEIDGDDKSAAPTVKALAGAFAIDDDDYRTAKERVRAFRDAGDFFDALVDSVDEGTLAPSGKHGRELAQLAECLLYVIGRQRPYVIDGEDVDDDAVVPRAEEVVHALREVMRVLEVDWNLDVGHRHYELAIAAACRCGDWGAAADIFEKQIDPNAGGSPVRVSVENPVALYAMARRYLKQQQHQRRNDDRRVGDDGSGVVDDDDDFARSKRTAPLHAEDNAVADQVMDAVQRLIMVSPQDQSAYVLAAGNALGHAGCWRELDEYRRSTFLAKQYGTALLAATLRACLLNGEHATALGVLIDEGILSPSAPSDEFSDETTTTTTNRRRRTHHKLEEEWQWGGARDRMDPLIRDLAMQVLGGVSVLDHPSRAGHRDGDDGTEGYDSRLALKLFRESREEGVTISGEALLGVAKACERDRNWRGALSVLRTVVDEAMVEEETADLGRGDSVRGEIAPWIVSGDELSIAERDQIGTSDGDDRRRTTTTTRLSDLGPFLASFMRTCNSASNFGTSLFGLRLFRSRLNRSGGHPTETDGPSPPEEDIVRTLSAMNIAGLSDESEEIVAASMVALTGLRCHENAMRLYEIAAGDVATGRAAAAAAASSFLYRYASRNQSRHGTTILGNPWRTAHDDIDRLIRASLLARTIIVRGKAASSSSGGGVAASLRDHHRREGLEELLARAMRSCTSAHQPELALYLYGWTNDTAFAPRRDPSARFPLPSNGRETNGAVDADDGAGPASCGDSVTAERILALRHTEDLDGAIGLLEDVLERHADEDDLVRWRKTLAEGLSALVAGGRGSDAATVFGALGGDARSADGYAAIGRHLSKVEDWTELLDLYRDASSEGYGSEELGLLAMKAVTSTRVDNRLRILRAIADECAAIAGLDAKRWTTTRYWRIKRALGFYHARLLMWWNDADRAPLDEANLAIKELRRATAAGIRPSGDALRAIVAGAEARDSLGLDRVGGYHEVPRTPEEWSELLGEVLEAVRDSSMRCDPNFVDSVVSAYGALDRPGDCLSYVSGVLDSAADGDGGGTRIRRSTLARIADIAAAEEGGGAPFPSSGVHRDVAMLLSGGGGEHR